MFPDVSTSKVDAQRRAKTALVRRHVFLPRSGEACPPLPSPTCRTRILLGFLRQAVWISLKAIDPSLWLNDFLGSAKRGTGKNLVRVWGLETRNLSLSST